MKKLTQTFKIILIAVFTAILVSCASTYDYTGFRESRPRSILVMPPANQSLEIAAPMTYLSTSVYPLAESGYYVIPVAISEEMFRQNGVTVAEEAHAIPFDKLHDIFGADAALYITVTRFGVSYRLTSSVTEAEANVRLVDLKTGTEIWSGKARAEDSSGAVRASGLAGLLLSTAINQAVNVLSDKSHDVGRTANYRMLTAGSTDGMLYGPYHPKFGTD